MNKNLIDEVFKRFKNEYNLNYHVLNSYPKNSKEKFIISDEFGYKYMNNYCGLLKNIKRGSKMDFVSTWNPYTIDNIKIWLKNNLSNLELLDEEFVKAKHKMKFKCLKCGIVESSWDDISHGAGCPSCNLLRKYNNEDVLKIIDEYSKCCGIRYKWISGEYIRSKVKNIELEDEAGFKYVTCIFNLSVNKGSKIYKFNDFNPYKEYNLELHKKMYGYDVSKKYEERRCIPGYTKWVKKVLKRDCYTCKCCGSKGGNLNTHHLNGYNWDIENRVNVDNGITLCVYCHREFHSMFGCGDNTAEQFFEYIKQKEINKVS